MDKRYQVFVSSTFRDLQDERRAIIQALLELDCIPAGMELFPASDESQWELIRRVIADCDYYIVVVGGRYGSTDSSGVSYTEREYDLAVEIGLPVLGFVHADPDQIPSGKSELATEARAKLDAFREKVRSRMCRDWRTADDLGGAVSRSLVQAIKRTPAVGWVRADTTGSPEQINQLRNRIDELTAELNAVRTAPPPDTKHLASGRTPFTVHYTLGVGMDIRFSSEEVLSWDDLFALLGPLMFDEASEHSLLLALEKKLRDLNGNTEPFLAVHVNPDDFQTIKVQLIALGLITKSTRKRGVKDSGTYWSLTPYGERYALLLKAIPATAT